MKYGIVDHFEYATQVIAGSTMYKDVNQNSYNLNNYLYLQPHMTKIEQQSGTPVSFATGGWLYALYITQVMKQSGIPT